MKKDFIIRLAALSDLAALLALERQVFPRDRLSERQYRYHIASHSSVLLVAMRSQKLLGSILLFFRKKSSIARLYSIAVDPDTQGMGVGTALLNTAERIAGEQTCTRLRLEVRQDNLAAIRLYEKLEYRRFDSYESYYEDGADAWRYEKRLR